jgi:hypothetical protein
MSGGSRPDRCHAAEQMLQSLLYPCSCMMHHPAAAIEKIIIFSQNPLMWLVGGIVFFEISHCTEASLSATSPHLSSVGPCESCENGLHALRVAPHRHAGHHPRFSMVFCFSSGLSVAFAPLAGGPNRWAGVPRFGSSRPKPTQRHTSHRTRDRSSRQCQIDACPGSWQLKDSTSRFSLDFVKIWRWPAKPVIHN